LWIIYPQPLIIQVVPFSIFSNGIIRGPENVNHLKSLKSEISWHCPFKHKVAHAQYFSTLHKKTFLNIPPKNNLFQGMDHGRHSGGKMCINLQQQKMYALILLHINQYTVQYRSLENIYYYTIKIRYNSCHWIFLTKKYMLFLLEKFFLNFLLSNLLW
jgi:hypothetical protein